GSPPSAGSPMLPDLSYMSTRFTAGKGAVFRGGKHPAFVAAGAFEKLPGSPPFPPPLPPGSRRSGLSGLPPATKRELVTRARIVPTMKTSAKKRGAGRPWESARPRGPQANHSVAAPVVDELRQVLFLVLQTEELRAVGPDDDRVGAPLVDHEAFAGVLGTGG